MRPFEEIAAVNRRFQRKKCKKIKCKARSNSSSPGDAVVEICTSAGCDERLACVGLAKESLCHPSLSTNHFNFPGSAVTGLCSAHWAGKRRAGLDSFDIYTCALANGMTHSGMGGGFRRAQKQQRAT